MIDTSVLDRAALSAYPDGSTRNGPQVTLSSASTSSQVPDKQVRRVVCHRINNVKKQEEYLVEWRGNFVCTPYSWHVVAELSGSLRKVQRYLEALYKERQSRQIKQDRSKHVLPLIGQKRKTPDQDSSSPIASSRSSPSASSSNGTSGLAIYAPSYNGTLKYKAGVISIEPWPTEQCFQSTLPTSPMEAQALDRRHQTSIAEYEIRNEFLKKLTALPGAPITLHPGSVGAPPLTFEFVTESVLREGVTRADSETVVGCGVTKHANQVCRPDMGHGMGCEYSRVCDCLEFAPVDESRMTEEQKELHRNGETMGIAKRFPYSNPAGLRGPRLVGFYLEKRDTIYECNPKCKCGPGCKTRLVQKGRHITLEIFRTEKRGWGLRCPEPIYKGQFIDTYRGEILTLKDAQIREAKSTSKGKGSYLYDLDKNVLDEDGNHTSEDFYVVDGEYLGGPTRFINHSCEPNLGQYVVSLNKYDTNIYELAFFALEDIPAKTELTFDYLDRESEDDNQESDDEKGQRCYCGAPSCRRWLWR